MTVSQTIDPHFSEKSYEVNREKFKVFDPNVISEKSGIGYHQAEGFFQVPVFDQDYKVYWPDGRICYEDGGEVQGYSVKILLMRYLMGVNGKEPTGEFVGYKELPSGNLYYANFYSRCIKVFAALFNERLDALKQCMEQIGAVPFKKGDAAWRFECLPGIHMACILWNGDEEFEPEGQILFDKNISEVLNIKDLAVLGDVFIQFLKSINPL